MDDAVSLLYHSEERGGVSEWPNETAWKAVSLYPDPWGRNPPPPPTHNIFSPQTIQEPG